MPFVRTSLELLLLLLFRAARSLFLFQGVAFGCAWLAARALAPVDAPGWLRGAMLSALLLSAIFFAAGLLLIPARRWRLPRASGGPGPRWPWSALLALSLLALPALAARAASGLVPLWSEIATQLSAIGSWEELTQPGPSGLVMIPILLALGVPALVTAAACFSIALPLALLALLPTRSRLFPTLLAMGTLCQAALVLGGWLAADAFARLAEQAMALMAMEKDAEVLRVADQLGRATGLLVSTASALVVPLLGMLGWLAWLRLSGAAAAAHFARGAGPIAAEAQLAPRAHAPAYRPWVPTADEPQAEIRGAERPPPAQRAPVRRARHGLVALGAAMLVFAATDRMRTRATYLSSLPAPGATLAHPPEAVRVSFAAALDPASSLRITRLVVQPSAGEQPSEVEISRRQTSDASAQRTLEAVPSQLPAGLYRVSWQALPAGGGVPRVGSFSFGVGVPVPADSAGSEHSLQDRDSGARARRHTWAGGALLLVLGALLPRPLEARLRAAEALAMRGAGPPRRGGA